MNAKQIECIPFNDAAASHHVEVIIRRDGAVMWVNVDGICVCRVYCDLAPILIKDSRYEHK